MPEFTRVEEVETKGHLSPSEVRGATIGIFADIGTSNCHIHPELGRDMLEQLQSEFGRAAIGLVLSRLSNFHDIHTPQEVMKLEKMVFGCQEQLQEFSARILTLLTKGELEDMGKGIAAEVFLALLLDILEIPHLLSNYRKDFDGVDLQINKIDVDVTASTIDIKNKMQSKSTTVPIFLPIGQRKLQIAQEKELAPTIVQTIAEMSRKNPNIDIDELAHGTGWEEVRLPDSPQGAKNWADVLGSIIGVNMIRYTDKTCGITDERKKRKAGDLMAYLCRYTQTRP